MTTISVANIEALIKKWDNTSYYPSQSDEVIDGILSDLHNLLSQPTPPLIEEVGQYGVSYVAERIPEGVMVGPAKPPPCYIAGKIKGLSEAQWQSNFAAARQEATALGYTPVCPTLLPHNHSLTLEAYMREDLIAMLGCDAVFAQRNWQDSQGATQEVDLAKVLGMKIIYQQGGKDANK